ncbi:unnamed protein product, partial [Mesorhabditis belari]|uniref:Ig-like domain-containing protein n=1 Tax=Mesorhabditis belari TaxID=2138241 RepID=A0AAF3EIV6_9BILA
MIQYAFFILAGLEIIGQVKTGETTGTSLTSITTKNTRILATTATSTAPVNCSCPTIATAVNPAPSPPYSIESIGVSNCQPYTASYVCKSLNSTNRLGSLGWDESGMLLWNNTFCSSNYVAYEIILTCDTIPAPGDTDNFYKYQGSLWAFELCVTYGYDVKCDPNSTTTTATSPTTTTKIAQCVCSTVASNVSSAPGPPYSVQPTGVSNCQPFDIPTTCHSTTSTDMMSFLAWDEGRLWVYRRCLSLGYDVTCDSNPTTTSIITTTTATLPQCVCPTVAVDVSQAPSPPYPVQLTEADTCNSFSTVYTCNSTSPYDWITQISWDDQGNLLKNISYCSKDYARNALLITCNTIAVSSSTVNYYKYQGALWAYKKCFNNGYNVNCSPNSTKTLPACNCPTVAINVNPAPSPPYLNLPPGTGGCRPLFTTYTCSSTTLTDWMTLLAWNENGNLIANSSYCSRDKNANELPISCDTMPATRDNVNYYKTSGALWAYKRCINNGFNAACRDTT